MLSPFAVRLVACVIVTCASMALAEERPLRIARGGGQLSPSFTIEVNKKFTKKMAEWAKLDKDKPALSADGVSGGPVGEQSVASSECLLAETLASKFFDSARDPKPVAELEAQLKQFCDHAVGAVLTENQEKARRALDERVAAHVDDAVIHIVKWNDDHSRKGTWYHYRRAAGDWTGNLIGGFDPVSELTEILGNKNVAFLAIHLNVDDTCQIKYKFEAKHTRPLNQENAILLFKTAVAILSKGAAAQAAAAQGAVNAAVNADGNDAGDQPAPPPAIAAVGAIKRVLINADGIGVWGGELFLAMPELPASLTFTGSVGGKVGELRDDSSAFEVRNSCSVVAAVPSGGKASSVTSPTSAGKEMPGKVVPRNLVAGMPVFVGEDSAKPAENKPAAVTPAETKKEEAADMAATVINEGLHHWDVSVGMPVKNHKSVKLESDSLLVVPKDVNDIRPYALVDIYPWAADLHTVSSRSKRFIITPPKFSFGIPMGNAPFNHPFLGAGFGILTKWVRFSPVIGIRYDKEVRNKTLVAGATASSGNLKLDQYTKRVAKLAVMITFSLTDARRMLNLKD